MAIQTFTVGQILTAAQQNALQANDYNQTVSTKTANYVLTAADKGTRVVMNSATATTITVNTSLFSAGDSLRLQNINTGATVVTAGTATVTSAGSLSVPQWGGGQLFFTSASAAVYFPDAVNVSSGLNFISGTTFSAVSTVSLPTNTFSATYTNYKIIYTVTAASTDSTAINVRLRAAGTDSSAASYSNAGVTYQIGAATIAANNQNGGTAWQITNFNSSDRNKIVLEIMSPQVAADTNFFWDTYGRVGGAQGGGHGNGEFRAATQFDSLTLFPSAGTITGSYQVYGYAIA